VPLGDVGTEVVEHLRADLARKLGATAVTWQQMSLPREALRPNRSPYAGSLVLRGLKQNDRFGPGKVLGITEADLFAGDLSFVFGQAELGGRFAVMSLARLRDEFYAAPPAPERFKTRMLKEALHELGHTLGLGHCAGANCVMRFSNSLADTDRKQAGFCQRCAARLAAGTGS